MTDAGADGESDVYVVSYGEDYGGVRPVGVWSTRQEAIDKARARRDTPPDETYDRNDGSYLVRWSHGAVAEVHPTEFNRNKEGDK
jgi:hypothetical protein